MKRLSLFLILLCCVATVQGWKGRALPLSFDKITNEWNALLGHDVASNKWQDFSQEALQGQRGNEVAQVALAKLTNNQYKISISRVPWRKLNNNDVIHFVPVKFIPARDLYQTARNILVDDYAWIPVSQLLNSSSIPQQTRRGQRILSINPEISTILKQHWNKISAELSTPSIGSSQPSTSAPVAAAGSSWQNIPGAIYFYHRGQPYYEFTNFFETGVPLVIDNQQWPTTEHYYQAQKFTQMPHIAQQIKNTSGASSIFRIAQANKAYVDSDWQSRSLQTMIKAVREKFNQDQNLARLLVGTGNKILVEDAGANDSFYGAGADYQGSNYLGQILMHIRDELSGKIALGSHLKLAKNPADYFYHKEKEKKCPVDIGSPPVVTPSSSSPIQPTQASPSGWDYVAQFLGIKKDQPKPTPTAQEPNLITRLKQLENRLNQLLIELS